MQFVNPIEILELQYADASSIDSTIIKKAKRKLFADIELSDDGHYMYKGNSLTKSDCEKSIQELENRTLVEYYLHLVNNKKLNDYLAKNDETIFSEFKHEGIYKLEEFVHFISPHFAAKFSKSLLSAFTQGNTDKLRAILWTQSLISAKDYNSAFKGLSNELQHRIDTVEKITSSIENEESEYSADRLNEIITVIEKLFPISTLNLLPAYFQSQLNKIAASINFLSVAIWNEYNSAAIPLQLLEHLLQLNIESVHKPTFEKNHKLYEQKHHERIEQEKNAPTLKKWASILLGVRSHQTSVESKSLNAQQAFSNTVSSFSVTELNNLPSFANEIRTQIAYSVRGLSIACWNSQADLSSALGLIDVALRINVPADVLTQFQRDKVDLAEMERKYRGIFICDFCEKNTPAETCAYKVTIYRETARGYRSVAFNYNEMSIPRCSSCKETHNKALQKFHLALWSSVAVGVLLGAVTNGEHFIIGGIVGLIIGWFVGGRMQANYIRSQGIKDLRVPTLTKHPILAPRIKEGWTFTKPTA